MNSTVRNEKGISLATTLVIGTVSTLWVGAISATVLPAYNRVSVTKCKNIARTCSETALDMVVGDLNRNFDPSTGWSRSRYDQPTTGASPNRTTIVVPTPAGMTASTEVFVYNRLPGGPSSGSNFSTIYDQTLDNTTAQEKAKYYRIIETRTRIGVSQKTVRAVLEPMFSGAGSIVFPYAAFGADAMTIVGRNIVDSYAPGESPDPLKDMTGAHVGSNVNTGHVGQDIYNYMRIGGNQYEFPNPVASQTQVLQNISRDFNATLVSQAKWCQYFGSVYSNGSNTAHWPAQAGDFVSNASAPIMPSQALRDHLQPDRNGTDNVRGLNNTYASGPNAGKWLPQPSDVNAPIDANGTGGVYATPPADGRTVTNRAVETMMDYQKVQMVPAPSAPSNAIDLGAINLSGNAKITIRQGAAAPASGFQVGSRSSGEVILPPGNYKLASVSLAGTSTLNVESGSVSLFIEGSSPTTMLSVAKTATFNSTSSTPAANMKIYTNKSSDMVINGNAKSVIYAPNARIFVGTGSDSRSQQGFNITNPNGSTVNLSGFGSGSTNLDYWGSIVGRESYLLANPSDAGSQVRFHYDRSLAPANFQYRVRPNGGAAPSFGPRTFSGWRAVSYQEDPAPLI